MAQRISSRPALIQKSGFRHVYEVPVPRLQRARPHNSYIFIELSCIDPHRIQGPFTPKAGAAPLSPRQYMAKFMVRVVLHDRPTASDYDRLDVAMCESGFLQELAGKRSAYHLPNGEYWYKGKT